MEPKKPLEKQICYYKIQIFVAKKSLEKQIATKQNCLKTIKLLGKHRQVATKHESLELKKPLGKTQIDCYITCTFRA